MSTKLEEIMHESSAAASTAASITTHFGTRKVSYGEEILDVSPLKIGQIPAFARAIRPMLATLADTFTSAPAGEGKSSGVELQVDIEELVDLVAVHGDAMVDAVAIAIGKKREEIAGSGDLVGFVDLVVAIIEVNADFIARAVAKATNLQTRVTKVVDQGA